MTWKIDRMDRIGLLAVGLVTAAAWAGWSGRNSLSALIGGVMGLANLRLWRGIVHGLIARHGAWKLTAGRLFLKFILVGGLVWVVLRSPLTPLGVLAGFGSALAALLWVSWFPDDDGH